MTRYAPIALAILGFVVILVALYGCASGPAIHCPPLVQYPALEQQVLAAELPSAGPETQVQIEDYLKLRQSCKQ